MTEFLLTLAALSVGGAAAVLIFALATRASRARYGARWRCWIWLLLCLRLLVPYSWISQLDSSREAPIQISAPSDTVIFEYDFPVQNTPPAVTGGNSTPTVVPTPGGSQPVTTAPPVTPTNPIQTGTVEGPGEPDTGDPDADKPKLELTLSDILTAVWAAGALVMAVWVVVSHLRFVRYIRRWSRPVEDPDAIRMYNQLGDQLGLDRRPNLRICTGLKAPMLAGIFSPRLLLPEDAPTGDELRYTLVHELTHCKRRDIWLKSIALLTNIVHWFNPFLWYMVRLVERDTELACDEAALRMLPPEDHGAYGRTILNAVERLKLRNR